MKKYFKITGFILLFSQLLFISQVEASTKLGSYKVYLPIHSYGLTSPLPHGYSPDEIKKAYNLPSWGGKGTITIIAAYDDPNIEHDLGVFTKQFALAPCTTSNSCFEKYSLDPNKKTNSEWC